MRGVAVDRDDTGSSKPVDLVALLRDDGVLEAAPFERRTDQPSHPAVPADDGMVDEGRALPLVDGGEVPDPATHQRPQPGLVAQPAVEWLDEREENGIERDGQKRSGDDQLESTCREEAERQAQRSDDERELADLSEPGGNREGDPRRVSGNEDDGERYEWLRDHDQGDDGHDGERAGDQVRRVEQHPDRHEEQHGERVT